MRMYNFTATNTKKLHEKYNSLDSKTLPPAELVEWM
jgi:hypothetical protein